MSASTVKGDRKREIGQSPIKKKFRNSTISREDIEAIANGIKLAFKEQQSTLDSVLIPALRKLREDIQATNNSVKELREEFEAMAASRHMTALILFRQLHVRIGMQISMCPILCPKLLKHWCLIF